MTVPEACAAYLRDLKARNLRPRTIENNECLMRLVEAFARDGSINSLAEIDTPAICAWRESWTCAPSTHRTRLIQLRAFFTHATRAGWIAASPANGVRLPKAERPPTMPLSVDEVQALLSASAHKPKEQALILLLRYSGLSIVDATTLNRSAVQDTGELVLRRAKSGELVTVLLPPEALTALDALPHRPHYFWTGQSRPVTAAKYWRRRLNKIAAAAGVEGYHAHRLRDTFAVELLLAGVAMHDVSTLLGHSSVQTTERYYAPWNEARRGRLVSVVREVHLRDPILRGFTPRKPAGTMTLAPAEADLVTHPEKSALPAHGSR